MMSGAALAALPERGRRGGERRCASEVGDAREGEAASKQPGVRCAERTHGP